MDGAIYIKSYGCQMNERDSEIMVGLLLKYGYRIASDISKADVILINTCAVRDHAAQRVYGEINQLKKLKMKNSQLILGVGGCLAQSEREGILKRSPHVDLVFGPHSLYQLPELLKRIAQERKPLVEIRDSPGPVEKELASYRKDSLSAWVTIIEGCNNFCSYCIVPYVRGRERSRLPEEIVQEIEELARLGYKEVTLLGQNVNSYGRDLEEEIDFAGLLEKVNGIEGIERIRYVTSHPRDVSKRLIHAVRDLSKVCEHFHLPVQAGSDSVLQRMNRGYTVDFYKRIIDLIRREVPGASITTDIIVGFPGESEEDFQRTLNLIREVEFDAAFTFKYSPRAGTSAARMSPQIEEKVKQTRLEELIDLQREMSQRKNQRLIGRRLEVLVEGISKKSPKDLCSRTRTNKTVIFRGSRELIGKLLEVEIVDVQFLTLFGRLVTNSSRENEILQIGYGD